MWYLSKDYKSLKPINSKISINTKNSNKKIKKEIKELIKNTVFLKHIIKK